MLVYGSAPKNQAAGDLTRCRTLSAHRSLASRFSPPTCSSALRGAAITSQADVDTQAANRNAELWNAHVADLRSRFPLTEAQELEIRAGVVDERVHRAAVEEKDRLIKDRAFYRRLLDGDREANRQWGLLTSLLALRPVKRT